ncbi:hypothetical protein Tco_0551938 [Tanacetum coccineum]
MSGSEPGEMASGGSKAVVFPKFDMHIYTSELISSKLGKAVKEYCIPLDLHPRLSPSGMMMNKLPSWYSGLYIEQLEQGGLRVLFSSFFLVVIRHFGVHVSQLVPMGVNRVILFEIRCVSLNISLTVPLFWVFYKLCKQGYWFSFENKTESLTKKCFKKVTSSLKGWKKKFFLLDPRAIPDAMPWRHGDTDLYDDFSENYNENDDARLSEFLVPLRPPPRHFLYVCGLTMACRHLKLHYNIRDQDKNVIDMDTFLKLPTWTGTLTAFQKSLEKPNSKIAAAQEKKEEQSLAKAEAKRTGAGGAGAAPEVTKKPVAVVAPVVAKDILHVEREVVDLRGNTCVPTPPIVTNQPSPHLEHHNTHENAAFDAHSSQSSHQGNGDESVDHRYVPNWGLRDDLHIYTFRVCRELISYLATPVEDEFLGNLSNVKFISRAYQTMWQSILAQGELLKRHEQLNHDYVDLQNCDDAHLVDLEHLRATLRRANQDNDGLSKKLTLLDSVHSECSSREKELSDRVEDLPRIRVLEREKLALSTEVAQAEADRKKLVREFIHVVVKRLHTSVEYRKSLAASEAKHQELFTMHYTYIQKVTESYDLLMSELLEVSSNVPPPSKDGEASSNAAGGTG